jgi:hypothetical protein
VESKVSRSQAAAAACDDRGHSVTRVTRVGLDVCLRANARTKMKKEKNMSDGTHRVKMRKRPIHRESRVYAQRTLSS